MLVRLSNVPRSYDWGSREAIAALQGRDPSAVPEAEMWFGDHPGSPAVVEDGSGRTLDTWIATEGSAHGVREPLPFLLKLLAAESPLSIQAHPTIDQARAGFADEERAGTPRDAAHRNYRDENHKPEVIVAIAGDFEALAGFRPADELGRLLDALGVDDPATARLRAGLAGPDPEAALKEFVGGLLAGEFADAARAVIAATARAVQLPTGAAEFADDFAAVGRIEALHPGDPGVVFALLMNRLVLAKGEALFVPAGVPHAYLRGLGVEIMAASDNVLRGGLTTKHVDVPELLGVLDARPGHPGRLEPQREGAGVDVFAPPVADFVLVRVERSDAAEAETSVGLLGPSIALATRGAPTVAAAGQSIGLAPGEACLITPDEGSVLIGGAGEVFVARSGRPVSL